MTQEFAFIFDMDGVIVDSNPYHKMSLRLFCEKHGKVLTETELKTKIYGRTNKEWLANVFGNLSKEDLVRYAGEKEALYRQMYDKNIVPVEGLLDFLQALDNEHIPRAIGTSAPRENVDFTLQKTGTARFFETILDESHVVRGKPDPEIYIKVSAALGRSPSTCIVFEDSLSGVEAALRAGCKVVGITTTHTRDELVQANYVIDSFAGLDPLVVIDRIA